MEREGNMRYALFGLLALVGCVYARAPVIFSNIGTYGYTRCDSLGNPYIQVNEANAEDTILVKAILAHEYTHVKRMAGHCRNFMKKYLADRDFRLQEEIAGFCATVDFYVKRGQDRNILVEQMVNDLDLLYGFNKTPQEIFAKVTCKGG